MEQRQEQHQGPPEAPHTDSWLPWEIHAMAVNLHAQRHWTTNTCWPTSVLSRVFSGRGHPLHLYRTYGVQLTLGMWAGADSVITALSFLRTLPGHRQKTRKTAQDPAPQSATVWLWFAAALRLTPPVRPRPQWPHLLSEPHLPGPTLSPKTPNPRPLPKWKHPGEIPHIHLLHSSCLFPQGNHGGGRASPVSP